MTVYMIMFSFIMTIWQIKLYAWILISIIMHDALRVSVWVSVSSVYMGLRVYRVVNARLCVPIHYVSLFYKCMYVIAVVVIAPHVVFMCKPEIHVTNLESICSFATDYVLLLMGESPGRAVSCFQVVSQNMLHLVTKMSSKHECLRKDVNEVP